jgi:signal transduction histidine kinase
MLIAIILVSLAALLAASFGVGLMLNFRHRLETSVRELSAPSVATRQLLQDQQRYLQTFGDVANQIFFHVQEQHKELAELNKDIAGIHATVQSQENDPPNELVNKADDKYRQLSQDRLMAELAHSLATPMSGLKARILSLCDMYGEHENSDLYTDLLALKVRVETCEAVLATFRRVNQTAAADRSYRLASIADTLKLVHHDVDRRLRLNTRLESNIPASVEGFDNAFLATLLLPLLENAVEGSPLNGTVMLKFVDQPAYITLEVINAIQDSVAMDKVFTPGESTKDGHQGLGVPTARWLAESIRGGGMTANVSGNEFHALVRLPRRVQ